MAAAGIGNPAGYVPIFDGGNPRIIGGKVRNEIISGGVFVFASGATGVVSSGANSFTSSDLLFSRDASGGQFNGICVQTTTVSGNIAVATRGSFLLVCNGSVIPGTRVECDGNNAVRSVGTYVGSAFDGQRAIGRALTAGASGGYALIDINA
ncbi:MAG: hypothetical protein DRN49_03505 [Thaumarchaeota archaeon]|nr:MAG: hypothetical protein DRN49_03505 [Nitrososphaerota archaeon]